MLSPRGAEGEVDHSFFDSDADEGGSSRGGDMTEAHQSSGTKTQQTINQSSGDSPGRFFASKEEKDGSRLSSAPLMSYRQISPVGDRDYRALANRQQKTSMALLDEAHDNDMSNKSPNQTEEESSLSFALTEKEHSQSPSPTSAEEAESECCCSCRRSPTTVSPLKSPSSPEEREAGGSSAGSWDVSSRRSEQSDYTVSPLSSANISPLQLLDLNDREEEKEEQEQQEQQEEQEQEERQQESAPSSGLSNTSSSEDSDQDEFDLSSESQFGGGPAACYTVQRTKKNYSFSNDDVRRMDQENNRLLQVLSRISSRPESAAQKKSSKQHTLRHYHSEVNRQRERKRIARDNKAFLKRLEAVKPSRGMRRSEQLADHRRQASYLGRASAEEEARHAPRCSRLPAGLTRQQATALPPTPAPEQFVCPHTPAARRYPHQMNHAPAAQNRSEFQCMPFSYEDHRRRFSGLRNSQVSGGSWVQHGDQA